MPISASSIFWMIVMGPCVFSCGTHIRRTLLLAYCSYLDSWTEFDSLSLLSLDRIDETLNIPLRPISPVGCVHGVQFSRSLKQRPDLPTNMCKVRTVKKTMPLIAYRMCIAQRALAQLPGDHWPCKPALLNRQGMGAHPKLHQ